MPKLILKFEAAVIKEFPFIGSVITVGRKPDNDLRIDHPAVSGHHLRILLQGDTYFAEDLNSTNGTLVNDKKIMKAGIHNNDVITVAKHSLVFVDDRPIAAQAAPADKPAAPALVQESAPASAVDKPAPPPAPVPITTPPPQAKTEPPSLDALAGKKKTFDKIGGLIVTEGAVDQTEFILKENSTYIGKSDRVAIKIKGMMAPEVAAMVAKKPDGFVLMAVKDGYPKINGMAVKGERPLHEGDIIEVGGTKLQFYLKNP